MKNQRTNGKKQGSGNRVLTVLKREKFGILVLFLAAAVFFCVRAFLNAQTANGPKTLSSVAADLEGTPALSDEMAVLTVSTDGETWLFENGGKYLTAGAQESLFFSDKRLPESEWEVQKQADGSFYLVNEAATHEGEPLCVSYLAGFTTYYYHENSSTMKLRFYNVPEDGGALTVCAAEPEDRSAVVIAHPRSGTVLTAALTDEAKTGDYAEYEKAKVLKVLSDSTVRDDASDGGWRGEQVLLAEILSGRYKGDRMEVTYNVGPLQGDPVKEGDGVAVILSTYKDGTVRGTVYEYDRIPALIAIVAVFFLIVALVGGRTGVKSLLGLVFTFLCLFGLLIPLLLRGFPTLPSVFVTAVFVAVVSFTLLGGVHRKTVTAMLGSVAGTAIALGFGVLAQTLARVNGLRISDVEALLQLRQTGTPIGLRGLLVAGVVISALGAVMDVSMSIASALEEVHAADGTLGVRALFRSGMNIGRDMVGTMTNTLILAFLGSGLTLIIYLYSLHLQPFQLYPSSYVALELISGVASSIGMVLSIPVTALLSAFLLGRKKTARTK